MRFSFVISKVALLILTVLALTSCKPYVTSNFVEHFCLLGDDLNPDQTKATLQALHQWASREGYTLLRTPSDLQAATKWASSATHYSEVYRKPLDPRQSKSMFVITVFEVSHPGVMELCLTAERCGDDSDHRRQIPLVGDQAHRFYEAFKRFSWLHKA